MQQTESKSISPETFWTGHPWQVGEGSFGKALLVRSEAMLQVAQQFLSQSSHEHLKSFSHVAGRSEVDMQNGWCQQSLSKRDGGQPEMSLCEQRWYIEIGDDALRHYNLSGCSQRRETSFWSVWALPRTCLAWQCAGEHPSKLACHFRDCTSATVTCAYESQ